jgi:hypothetical protein
VSFAAHYSFDIRPTRVSLRSRKAVVVEAAKKSVGDLSKADLEASIRAIVPARPIPRAHRAPARGCEPMPSHRDAGRGSAGRNVALRGGIAC